MTYFLNSDSDFEKNFKNSKKSKNIAANQPQKVVSRLKNWRKIGNFNKTWYVSLPKYDSVRVIDMDQEFMDLLRREKNRQKESRANYAEFYTRYYINEDKQLNTDGDGKEISLIAVRENGTFINPRCMQHTSGDSPPRVGL